MSLQEIEDAITHLPTNDVAELADWLAEFQSRAWDAQIEHDFQAGKLDRLMEQAGRDFDAGRCKPL
jgi:hypothetical protein